MELRPPVLQRPAYITRSPTTLPALLAMVVTGITTNIRGMAKGVIKAMIISFAAVLVLQTLLLATNLDTGDLVNSVLAVAGLQSSPNALLFWFLFTAIIAFFYSQATSRGLRSTVSRFTTLPDWIGTAARTTGSIGFPLLMAGVAIALIVRFYLLTALTGIQFLILLFGILYSQQESIAVLAMRLLYSDLNRVVKKTGPALPSPAVPVIGIAGAFIGFVIVLFISDIPLLIAAAVILMIAGTAAIWYQRKKAHPAGLTALVVLVSSSWRLL
jgi:hypothetical protein